LEPAVVLGAVLVALAVLGPALDLEVVVEPEVLEAFLEVLPKVVLLAVALLDVDADVDVDVLSVVFLTVVLEVEVVLVLALGFSSFFILFLASSRNAAAKEAQAASHSPVTSS